MKKVFIIIISIMVMFLIACNSTENGISNMIINNQDTSEISEDENLEGESSNNNESFENTADNTGELESDTEEPEKEFAFTSAEEVENISDEDLLYIYNHNYDTYDFFPEGEYTGIDYFGMEMLAPTEDHPETATEGLFFSF